MWPHLIISNLMGERRFWPQRLGSSLARAVEPAWGRCWRLPGPERSPRPRHGAELSASRSRVFPATQQGRGYYPRFTEEEAEGSQVE